MNDSKYPAGWDAERVKKLIDYYESLSEDEEVAEDEAGVSEGGGLGVVMVPEELIPAVRRFLAARKKEAEKAGAPKE